jgi:hypothetical protein
MRISHDRLRQMVKEEYTQAARSTGVISESKLRYKLYEAALETGLSSSQYHALMSEGVFSWIKKALLDIDTGKELAGELKKMFADKKNQVIYKKATEEIQKNVAELFKAGAAAGIDKKALKDWLVAGINKITEETAASSPGASGSTTSGPDAVGPGTTIDASQPETAVPALTNAGAEAAGVNQQQAIEDVAKKKVDVAKVTQILAKAIAQKANVDVAKVSKIIDYLISNRHMVTEGRRVTKIDILSSIREIQRLNEDLQIVKRINMLAGLINEAEEVPKDVAGKFEKLQGEIRKKFGEQEMSDDDILGVLWRLDDLDSIEIK